MKPLVRAIIAILIGTISCKADILFKKTSNGVMFEVLSAQGQPWWGGGENSSSAYFRISHDGAVQAYYGYCGIIFGVLVEGLAMNPDAKEVDSGPNKEWSVEFIRRDGRINLKIDRLTVVLTRAEANQLVNALSEYWMKRDTRPVSQTDSPQPANAKDLQGADEEEGGDHSAGPRRPNGADNRKGRANREEK